MKELVSIIMPSYNTAEYIATTIESVLSQSYIHWELIIVDDCSTDNTDDVVRPYMKDERIHYLKNRKNSGAAVSRNQALREAKGEWIAFLDSDDIWKKDKLRNQLYFMLTKGYSFSYTAYEEIDETGNKRGVKVSGPKRISKYGMYAYCWPGCLTVMYNRRVIGDIQIEDIRKNNDYAMWLQICKKADCYLYPKVMAQYRKRSGSISNYGYSKMIKWHFRLFNEADKKNTIESVLLTSLNLVFGVVKKCIYVNKYESN